MPGRSLSCAMAASVIAVFSRLRSSSALSGASCSITASPTPVSARFKRCKCGRTCKWARSASVTITPVRSTRDNVAVGSALELAADFLDRGDVGRPDRQPEESHSDEIAIPNTANPRSNRFIAVQLPDKCYEKSDVPAGCPTGARRTDSQFRA